MARCTCPNTSALPTVPTTNCEFNLGQVQKIMIVKPNKVIWDAINTGGTGTGGVPVVDAVMTDKADWQLRFAAADDTKIVLLPTITSTTIAGGEPNITGQGDNSTINGMGELVGYAPSVLAGEFKGLTSEQIAAIRSIGCNTELEVYFITDQKQIIGAKTGNGVTTKGILARLFALGGTTTEGWQAKNINTFSISMEAGWDENLAVASPTWNPYFIDIP